MIRIAVLLSNKGSGSNLEAILKSIEKRFITGGTVAVVVSDKKDAYGLVRAKNRNIPTVVLDFAEYKIDGRSRIQYDKDLAKLLKNKYNVDLVVLAGWMRILSDKFINLFPERTINLHPGLLPDGKSRFITLSNGKKIPAIRGLHTDAAVKFAIDHKFPVTGSTVHFITPIVDNGPVILRSEVAIKPDDTVESLYERMKIEEHKILPNAIKLYCENRLRIKRGKVIITDAKR